MLVHADRQMSKHSFGQNSTGAFWQNIQTFDRIRNSEYTSVKFMGLSNLEFLRVNYTMTLPPKCPVSFHPASVFPPPRHHHHLSAIMLAWRLVRLAAVNLTDLIMSPCGTPPPPLKNPARNPPPPLLLYWCVVEWRSPQTHHTAPHPDREPVTRDTIDQPPPAIRMTRSRDEIDARFGRNTGGGKRTQADETKVDCRWGVSRWDWGVGGRVACIEGSSSAHSRPQQDLISSPTAEIHLRQ